MNNGWVKLHRGLLEHGIFKDAEVLQVWMYLLLRASYREQKLAIGRQVILLQPGQLLYGRKAVSDKLGMGEGKLRGIMEMLMRTGSIMVESTNRYSVVTIVNWMEYQQGESAPEFPFDVDFFEDEPLRSLDYARDDEVEKSLESSRCHTPFWCGTRDDEVVSFRPEHCRGGYYPSEPKPEPTDHQPETLSASGFAGYDDDNFADFEPTENHIQEENNIINNKITKKYKIKKRENKITEKNNKELENNKKTKENDLNQENMKTKEHHYRQRAGVEEYCTDAACQTIASVTADKVGGESVIKGERVPERRRYRSVKDTLPEGWPAIPATAENCILLRGTDLVFPAPEAVRPKAAPAAPAVDNALSAIAADQPENLTLSDAFAEPDCAGYAIADVEPSCDNTFSYADTLAACDDSELESYFVGEYEGVYDDDLLAPFTIDEPTTEYQPRHEFTIEMRGPNEPLTYADLNQLEQLFQCAQNQARQDASEEEQTELEQARTMFDQLWRLYPEPMGYRKVSDAQKVKLYRMGYDTVAEAVQNYCFKKRRIRREYWMHGSTFFNGGFMDYLPEVA